MTVNDVDRPEHERLYRHWVEIRNLHDESVRTLPLRAVRLVYIPTSKTATPRPDEQRLELLDDSTVIKATYLDDLSVELKSRYPDEMYERRLCWEHDLDAEQRRADALDALIELLAQTAIDDILNEQTDTAPGTVPP